MNIRTKLIIALLAFTFACSGCSSTSETSSEVSANGSNGQTGGQQNDPSGNIEVGNSLDGNSEGQSKKSTPPQDVMGFFMSLPEKYFVIESCSKDKDKDCKRAKKRYLKDFLSVQDIRNGYLSAGADGAQTSFKMAIFKRGDNSYLIGLNVFSENNNTFKFLDFAGGKWEDVSIEVVPEYSTTNIYELPRLGTTVPVFAKKIIEQGEDFEVSEKGEKLYELHWKNGAFSIAR